MRPRTAIASLLVTAALIGGGAYALSTSQPNTQSAPAATALPPVPVVAEAVKSGNVPIYLRGIGVEIDDPTADSWLDIQATVGPPSAPLLAEATD